MKKETFLFFLLHVRFDHTHGAARAFFQSTEGVLRCERGRLSERFLVSPLLLVLLLVKIEGLTGFVCLDLGWWAVHSLADNFHLFAEWLAGSQP